MITIELYKLKQENNFEAFYTIISTFIPSLKKFTSSKLKIFENEGLIDKGFYNADGILDEVYMDIFESFSKKIDKKELRKMLFFKTIQKINEKTAIEDQFKNAININDILKEELDLLNEDYSVEADGDYIFNSELDDISYKQHSFKPTHFILDKPLEMELTGKLNLNEDLYPQGKRNLFGGLYQSLPPKSKMITELFVFGDQSVSEIAEILLIDEEKVRMVIFKIEEKFKSL